MKTLFVNACIRKESRTLKLSKHLLEKLDKDYIEVELQKCDLRALDEKRLDRKNELCLKSEFDDEFFALARQFKEAETIVIGAPYYDLSSPALLKEYLENTCVVGLTFHYVADDEPRSLSKVKKAIYVMTAGGTIVSHEYGYGYLKKLFETFYEVKDFEYFYAEKLDLPDIDIEAELEATKKQMDERIKTKQ